MSKPKYNQETMKKLLEVLVKYPDGIWLSRLAKEAGIAKSTTEDYLNKQLSAFTNENTLGEEKKIIRIVSLKPMVMEELRKGRSLDKIMQLLKVFKEYE